MLPLTVNHFLANEATKSHLSLTHFVVTPGVCLGQSTKDCVVTSDVNVRNLTEGTLWLLLHQAGCWQSGQSL